MSAVVLSAVMSVVLLSELLEKQRDREGVQIQCWCQYSSSVPTQLVTRVCAQPGPGRAEGPSHGHAGHPMSCGGFCSSSWSHRSGGDMVTGRQAGRQSKMSRWWGCEVTKRAHQEVMRRNQPEHQMFAKALHTQAVSSLAVGGCCPTGSACVQPDRWIPILPPH